MSRISIVGAGHLGTALTKRLIARGHAVRVANSRGLDTLRAFARQTGAEAVDIGDVASGADFLIVAIPLGQVRALLKAINPVRPAGLAEALLDAARMVAAFDEGFAAAGRAAGRRDFQADPSPRKLQFGMMRGFCPEHPVTL